MAVQKYLLSFQKVSSRFIATYTDGKFKRLELKSGKLSYDYWRGIGMVVPQLEKDIPQVVERYENRVHFEALNQANTKTTYNAFMGEYIQFYERKSNGIKPKIDGVEGSSLKKIIAYLNEVSGKEEESLLMWQQILSNWSKLDEFYQKQLLLRQINSNISNLIIQIQHGNQANSKAQGLREKVKRNS